MSHLLEIFEFGSMSANRLLRVHKAKTKKNLQEFRKCQNSSTGYRRCKKRLEDEYVRKTGQKELRKTIRQIRRRRVLDAQGHGGKTLSHKPHLQGNFRGGDVHIEPRIKGIREAETPNDTVARLQKHYYGRGIKKGGQGRYWVNR